MIRTCNGCYALNIGTNTFCALHEELETAKYVGGTAVGWKPKYGMCAKPKTRTAYSMYMRAMSATPLKGLKT